MKVESLGFGFVGLGFRVQGQGFGIGFKVWGSRLRFESLGTVMTEDLESRGPGMGNLGLGSGFQD